MFLRAARLIVIAGAAFAFAPNAAAQRVAVLTPEPNATTDRSAEILEHIIGNTANVVDRDAAAAAARSVDNPTPFNQTTDTAKRIGAVTGTDLFILIRTENLRRSAFGRDRYYDSAAAIFLVGSRSGSLRHFMLVEADADTPEAADEKMLKRLPDAATELATQIAEAYIAETSRSEEPFFDVYDPEKVPGLRPAMPYRRIRPEYVRTASRFRVEATVDAEANIDAEGRVRRIDILRWAGYGLNESVTAAITAMNWRAGELRGKSLPMRVLLRYNFRDIANENP